MSNGEPQRSMESPVAWPSYKGFPPDRDPVTKKAIDYALKPHGGRFALTLTLTLTLALALTLSRRTPGPCEGPRATERRRGPAPRVNRRQSSAMLSNVN